jgi:hypothetical protein
MEIFSQCSINRQKGETFNNPYIHRHIHRVTAALDTFFCPFHNSLFMIYLNRWLVSMTLFSVKYQTIDQKTDLPSGASGTVISASSSTEARHIFKCSHVDNKKIKYKIISVINIKK